MNIALDYDETFTRDPDAWYAAMFAMRQAGHTVYGVTMRYPREGLDIDRRYKELCSGGVHFTAREAKMRYMEDRGISIDVWIDDSPHFILRSAR